eukprot:3039971-Rhodomonas_salina.1
MWSWWAFWDCRLDPFVDAIHVLGVILSRAGNLQRAMSSRERQGVRDPHFGLACARAVQISLQNQYRDQSSANTHADTTESDLGFGCATYPTSARLRCVHFRLSLASHKCSALQLNPGKQLSAFINLSE